MKLAFSLLLAIVVSACAPPGSKRYNVDRQSTIKAITVGNITVAPFKAPTYIDDKCRAAGKITPPERTTFEAFIQQALADEIRATGAFNEAAPKMALFGELKTLVFSSTSTFSDAWWILKIRISSSNGKTMEIAEKYDFKTSFGADTACQEAADAYIPAVKKLVEKLVKSSQFTSLLTP